MNIAASLLGMFFRMMSLYGPASSGLCKAVSSFWVSSLSNIIMALLNPFSLPSVMSLKKGGAYRQ